MSVYNQTYTFEQAKKIAEKCVYKHLKLFLYNREINVLDENYLEAECCWFFFRNKLIEGPPEQALRWFCAYAVSKRGELRTIADFSDEPEKLQEYLWVMSNHFKEKNL